MRAKLYRDHFNTRLDGCGLAEMLYMTNGVHPPVQVAAANVELGAEYMRQFLSWMYDAAADLAKRTDMERARFTSGSFGSVWLDTTLTGKLTDSTPKAKAVRIALVPAHGASLRPKSDAVRVVDERAGLVKVKKQVRDGVWKLTTGEDVNEGELFPMHTLDDTMQYILVFDPTVDNQETF
jgi:hypothetical protein